MDRKAMISFPQISQFAGEPKFPSSELLGGRRANDSEGDGPGSILIELDGQREVIRFYGHMPAGDANEPVIFLDGDVLRNEEGQLVVDEAYRAADPLWMQAAVEQVAIGYDWPYIFLARPGTYGSSGDHRERRREREVALVDRALDRLKEAFNWRRLNLAGLSGGGHLVGALLARRVDIRCAVIASGNVSVAQRNREKGWAADITGYFDFVDPITLVDRVASHPPENVLVLTDPQDAVVSASVQTAYYLALRNIGVPTRQLMVTALDPKHHVLRLPAILAALRYASGVRAVL